MKPKAHARRHGFSLLELMIVIVIIAIAATGVTFAMGALTRSKLRSGAVKVVAACRFGYHRAVSKGNTVRVVFDLDAGTVAIEEAHGRVTLAGLREEHADEANEGSVDPWAAAQARLSTDRFAPSFGRSPFEAIADEDGDPIARYQAHELASDIRIVELITPHDPEPRTAGRGAIYFFPNGLAEEAYVRLEDPRGNRLTVEIGALTGRGIIHDGDYEPPDVHDETRGPRDPG